MMATLKIRAERLYTFTRIFIYAFFPELNLSGHHAVGNTISSVKIYLDSATTYLTSAELRIYSDLGVTSVHTQAFTPMDGWMAGWNEVVLNTKLQLLMVIPPVVMLVQRIQVETGLI